MPEPGSQRSAGVVASGTVSRTVRELDPSVFAFVMATGIVSVGLHEDAAGVLSGALLVVALVGYVTLWIASGWRVLRWQQSVFTDLGGPRAFSLLTAVAASNVMSSALVTDSWPAAAVLFVVGLALWLFLGYGVPLIWITSTRRRFRLDQVDGTWFHWVVSTQSVAVAAASLAASGPGTAVMVLALVCWAVGLVLYVLIASLVLARLLLRPVEPADLVPAYWIFMGAAAITVLSGMRLLHVPRLLVSQPALVGVSTVLLSFATWLVPLLIGLGVWRHLVRRVRLGYTTSLWSLVFPVGMYGVASHELGQAIHSRWLTTLAGVESWIAVVVWAAVFVAMLSTLLGRAWSTLVHTGR